MFRQLSLLLAGLAAVQASGEFVILHSPDSVKFIPSRINQSSLKEILSVALGYTGKQRDAEHNIVIWDPFSMPKALVAMPIEGIDMLSFMKDKVKVKYSMTCNEAEETTWQAVRNRVDERSNDNTLVRINLSDGVDALGQSALGELKPANIENLTMLNLDNEEDRKFIEEVQLLNAIADNASSTKRRISTTDIYWIVVSGLKPVVDFHGINSSATKEAYTLLNDAMENMSKAFMNVYDGKVLIAAFTNDASNVRNTRSVFLERQPRDTNTPAYKTNSVKTTGGAKGAPISSDFNDNLLIKRDNEQGRQNNKEGEEEITNSMLSTNESNTVDSTTERPGVQNDSRTSEKSDQDSINKDKINTNTQTIGQPEFSGRAKTYSEDYPVIFNIILWFGVIFCFSLLVICIAIGDMDPGRDSIIYRMTSNRMKKDN